MASESNLTVSTVIFLLDPKGSNVWKGLEWKRGFSVPQPFNTPVLFNETPLAYEIGFSLYHLYKEVTMRSEETSTLLAREAFVVIDKAWTPCILLCSYYSTTTRHPIFSFLYPPPNVVHWMQRVWNSVFKCITA